MVHDPIVHPPPRENRPQRIAEFVFVPFRIAHHRESPAMQQRLGEARFGVVGQDAVLCFRLHIVEAQHLRDASDSGKPVGVDGRRVEQAAHLRLDLLPFVVRRQIVTPQYRPPVDADHHRGIGQPGSGSQQRIGFIRPAECVQEPAGAEARGYVVGLQGSRSGIRIQCRQPFLLVRRILQREIEQCRCIDILEFYVPLAHCRVLDEKRKRFLFAAFQTEHFGL